MMETEKTSPRRRPRYSLRLLLILLTIACLYLGCWFPTATSGVRDINARYSMRSRPVAPLFLVTDIYESRMENGAPPKVVTQRTRIHYFWFFGWTANLGTTQGIHDPPPR
jgi:hypothetical protein